MNTLDVVQTAEALLSIYRDAFYLDPFYNIRIEVVEGDFVSVCVADQAPLTWIMRLNPARHETENDIQYSVIESVLKVIFHALSLESEAKFAEVKNGIIARLATAVSNMIPADIADQESDADDASDSTQ